MIVVSDASPLNVLIRARLIEHLGRVHSPILIPPAVAAEMSAAGTPKPVRDWLAQKPAWLEIKEPPHRDSGPRAGRGEREAIALAVQLHSQSPQQPALFLVDDTAARNRAQAVGLETINTLAVLELFSARGFSTLESSFSLLPSDFKIKDSQKEQALARETARSRQKSSTTQQPPRQVERPRSKPEREPDR